MQRKKLTLILLVSIFIPVFIFSQETNSEDTLNKSTLSTYELDYDTVAFNTKDSSAANNAFTIWQINQVDPYHIDVLKKKDTTYIYFGDSTSYHHPVNSLKVNSNFGYRKYRYHYGIDLELETGDPVYSAFKGRVRFAGYVSGYGNLVVVSHYNGLETLYGHLSAILVGVGDEVSAGKLIGFGGATGRATGSHLHFEIKFMGQQIDPNKIIDFSTGKLKAYTFPVCKQTFDYLIELSKAKYYTVKSGDSLWKISNKYGVSIATLCKLNHISRESVLRVGQRLRIQ